MKRTYLDRRWGIDVVLWFVQACSWPGQQWQQQKPWWLQRNWTCKGAPQQENKTSCLVSTNFEPIYTHKNAHTCAHTHTHKLPHTHMHACTHTHTLIQACMHAHTHAHTCHTHICLHTHTHTHACTQVCKHIFLCNLQITFQSIHALLHDMNMSWVPKHTFTGHLTGILKQQNIQTHKKTKVFKQIAGLWRRWASYQRLWFI